MITIQQRIVNLKGAAKLTESIGLANFLDDTADALEGLSAQYNRLAEAARETVRRGPPLVPAIKFLSRELKAQGQL